MSKRSPLNGLPYYKRFPRDFIEGTIGMSFEIKACYSLILDLIYMQNGTLPDNPRYISGLLGCSVRAWNKYRSDLISMGKIRVENGIISNFRADKEIESLRSFQDNQRKKASGSRKNKDIPEATADPKKSHTESEPESKKKEDSSSLRSEVSSAVEIYVAMAEKTGLPVPRTISDERRRKISATLKAYSLDMWREAVAAMGASDFCRGQNSRGWVAGLDFLLQRKSFDGLIEGKYANRQPRGKPRPPTSADYGSELLKEMMENGRSDQGEIDYRSFGLLPGPER